MTNITSSLILASLCLLTFKAQAVNSGGEFQHDPGYDQIQVYRKNGRPTLRIVDSKFPALQECGSGYKVVSNGNVDSSSYKTLNFSLVVDRSCYDALSGTDGKFHRFQLDQEVDVFNEIIGSSSDTAKYANDFQNNEIHIGITTKVSTNEDRPREISRTFSFGQTASQKTLINLNEAIATK